MIDYYVRPIPLPRRVEGVSIPNDDGSFDIYINSNLPPELQQKTLEHELRHLKAEHFYLIRFALYRINFRLSIACPCFFKIRYTAQFLG